ncbi:hypothetical protein LA52FAK_12820 [Desulforhopalus sp. 52FAK]
MVSALLLKARHKKTGSETPRNSGIEFEKCKFTLTTKALIPFIGVNNYYPTIACLNLT